MKQEIKKLLEYIKNINVGVLSASLSFYTLILLTPVLNIIQGILGELKIAPYEEYAFSNTLSLVSIIILVINSIWVVSKLMNITIIISDIVYVNIPKRESIKRRINAFLLMFCLVWFIIFEIIALLVIANLVTYIDNPNRYYFVAWIQFIIQFTSIVLIVSFIYKYIIPVIISFKVTTFMSLIVSVVWYVFTHFYQLICDKLNLWGNVYLYGSLTNFIVMSMWVYSICSVFIYGLVFIFYLTKMSKDKKNGNTINEQERSNEY